MNPALWTVQGLLGVFFSLAGLKSCPSPRHTAHAAELSKQRILSISG
jgi:hypothetical protein